jgi:aryl-alcohol dehydrogenase-like predicted oxidoreductase
MLPLCRSEGIAVTPWSPLVRGFLAGTGAREGAAATTRARTASLATGWLGIGSEQDHAIAQRVGEVARRLGVKPAQVALAWVLGLPGVTSPVVGASKPHHLGDAVGALSVTLDAETRAHLEEPYRSRPVQGHS